MGGHDDVAALQDAEVLENVYSNVTVLDSVLPCTRNLLREEIWDLRCSHHRKEEKRKTVKV